MTNTITRASAAARENARSADGKFGVQPAAEADLDLDAGVTDPAQAAETQLRQLLEQFPVLPATDGRGNDFETAFLDRYRDAAGFAAAHPDWEKLTSVGYQQSLAGPENTDLGRERGTSIVEADDESGGEGLVLHVHTRNGSGNRECWHSEDDETDENGRTQGCTGCVMDAITGHPNYLTDEDADYDETYADLYFSIPDQDAARTAVEAGHHQGDLQALNAIRAGQMAPWANRVGKHPQEGTDQEPGRLASKASSEAKALRARAASTAERAETAAKIEQSLQADEFPSADALIAAVGGGGYDPKRPRELTIAMQNLHQQRWMYRSEAENLVKYRGELRDSRRTVAEIDQVTTGLAEDSPLKAKLAKERKSLTGHQPTLEKLYEQNRERIEKRLSPFQRFAADVRTEDPQTLIAKAELLEAEANRQTMLVGWPEDPAGCPESMDKLRG